MHCYIVMILVRESKLKDFLTVCVCARVLPFSTTRALQRLGLLFVGIPFKIVTSRDLERFHCSSM